MADIVVKTVSLPAAVVGVAYEAGIAHNSSATAITACAVASGSLPPGIVINADFVRLTGTPTKAGTYTFTLTLTDTAGGVTTGSLSIVVSYVGKDQYGTDENASPLAAQYAKMWH